MRRLAAALLLAALVPLRLGAQDALGVPGALDDPGGRLAQALSAALERARAGGPSARLAFWGASHTASDQYTSVLRRELRRAAGDGGPGLVLPSLPFPLYEMRDVEVPDVPAFAGRFVRGARRTPGAYGRAGFALDVERRARAELTLRASAAPIAHVEVWAMAQPGGGSVGLEVNGREVASVDTEVGPPGTLVRAVADVAPGRHRFAVDVRGDGPVRLFGVLAESATPGVVVEAFGVPGARARDQEPWDAASFAEQLAVRPPDVVAIAYGTNESGDGTPLTQVEASVDAALDRLEAAAPGAACLVIGPSDRPRRRDGAWVARPRSTALAELFHRRAAAHGCAFFDLLAWQGGPGAIERWVGAGLALDDHVHLTDEGYAMLARALLRELGR